MSEVDVRGTREKILHVAQEVYAEVGESMSMRQIAREVGISATAIYRHFQNREELILAICREGFEDLEAMYEQVKSDRSAREELSDLAAVFLNFALSQPQRWEAMYVQTHISRLEKLDRSGGVLTRIFDRLATCMARGVEGGEFEGGEPEKLVLGIWGMAHGLLSLYFNGHLQMTEEEFRALYQVTFETMERGIQA